MRLPAAPAGWGIPAVKMKVLETLQDNAIFTVELVDWEGERALRKTLNAEANSRRAKSFKDELLGMEVFGKLAHTHPEWKLRVPEVYAKGEDWVVREFIEGSPLLEYDTSLDAARENVAKLAVQLANIDRVEPDATIHEQDDSAPYTNIRGGFSKWSKQPLAEGLLIQASYDATNALIDDYAGYLMPRYAHGDLNALSHVFISDDKRLAWIDFEHFSAHKPRYYDVAYCYSRLFTKAAQPEIAGEFLKNFLESAEIVSHQDEQLLAIMAQRAIGMHFDALNDLATGLDYRKRAQDFLARCLTRRVQNLLDFDV